MCNVCNQAREYQICWHCQNPLTQWRTFLYCRNVKCKKYSEMISLHTVELKDRFNDFWKDKRGMPIEN
jgi:hypothetical protein